MQKLIYSVRDVEMKYNYDKTKERQPIVYDGNNNFKTIKIYDGIEQREITGKQFREMKSKYNEYVFIKDNSNDLEKTLNNFVNNATLMKRETSGKVNMFITGGVPSTCVDVFFKMVNKQHIQIEPITPKEAIFIQNATGGGLIFSEEYQGELYKYDIISFYPSLYRSQYLYIPIRRGEFKKLTKDEFTSIEHYQIGIYRCVLHAPDKSEKWFKLFRMNNDNYYTHIELEYARSLGFKLELIEDGEDNFLHYSTDKCMKASQIFKEYVDLLFPLKQKGLIGGIAKELLNTLWGALTAENVIKMVADDDFVLYEGKVERRSYTTYEDITIKEIVDPNQLFSYDWARIKPFLTAKGRVTISKKMLPQIDHIHRCHTDGFVSDIKLDTKKTTKLGELRYEGYCEDALIIRKGKPKDPTDPKQDAIFI